MEVTRRLRCPVVRTCTALALALVGLASCGGPPRPPVTEIPGYLALKEEIGDYDFAPLAGRRIVIDPGHGGLFRGAVGVGGLSEAEVNLGVALYLRGLLEWAGAEVVLTRTADYDFLTAADSTLAADLAARIAIADSVAPDVFLSIHHNSNAALDRDMNETQTYYPVGREGADLDLARAIHKHLVKNLEIQPAKIMAGNFYVLRNATAPAVLGEPAMISHPVIEGRLSQARSQEIEAQAYFLGLLGYFAGGTPRFVAQDGDTIPWDRGRSGGRPLSWSFDPGGPAAPGLDPSSIRLILGGRPAETAILDGGAAVVLDPPRELAPGLHALSLMARNLAGRATPVLRQQLWCREPRSPVELERIDATADPRAERGTLLRWRSRQIDLAAFDRLALRVRDAEGTREVALPRHRGRRGWLVMPREEAEAIVGFTALPPSGPVQELAGGPAAQALALEGDWRWLVLDADPGVWADVVPGGGWRRRLSLPDGFPAWILDTTAPVVLAHAGDPLWLEAPGAGPLFVGADGREPWAPAASAADTLRWRPLLPALIGRTVVLDPAGGGSETDGTGPLGTRGADLNLRLAGMTAALLRGAGARVILTREDETWLPPEQKVLLANEVGADLFLAIGRSLEPDRVPYARHHHGSRAGEAWARAFARATRPLLAAEDTVRVEPSYAYLLRHTACPAMMVGLELPATMDDEDRIGHPAYQQAQARALLLAAAAALGGDGILDRTLDPCRIMAGAPTRVPLLAEIDWIMVDGNLFWMPPRWPRPVATPCTATPGLPWAGGEHVLEIRAGARWQLWAVRGALGVDGRPVDGWQWKLLIEDGDAGAQPDVSYRASGVAAPSPTVRGAAP